MEMVIETDADLDARPPRDVAATKVSGAHARYRRLVGSVSQEAVTSGA